MKTQVKSIMRTKDTILNQLHKTSDEIAVEFDRLYGANIIALEYSPSKEIRKRGSDLMGRLKTILEKDP